VVIPIGCRRDASGFLPAPTGSSFAFTATFSGSLHFFDVSAVGTGFEGLKGFAFMLVK
jgi:hypothetical protein